jgi:hypothetical protein
MTKPRARVLIENRKATSMKTMKKETTEEPANRPQSQAGRESPVALPLPCAPLITHHLSLATAFVPFALLCVS